MFNQISNLYFKRLLKVTSSVAVAVPILLGINQANADQTPTAPAVTPSVTPAVTPSVTPPAEPVAVPTSGANLAQTSDTPDFGFVHLVLHNDDIVLQLTFGFLVLMSVLSWTIILFQIVRGIYNRIKLNAHYRELHSQGSTFTQALSKMQGSSGVKTMLEQALASESDFRDNQGPLTANIPYADYLQQNIRVALDKSANSQDMGLSLLATIGATAPFVGLFGTV